MGVKCSQTDCCPLQKPLCILQLEQKCLSSFEGHRTSTKDATLRILHISHGDMHSLLQFHAQSTRAQKHRKQTSPYRVIPRADTERQR